MDLLYIYDDSKLPGPFPNEGTYLKLSGFLSLQPPSQCWPLKTNVFDKAEKDYIKVDESSHFYLFF